MVEAETHADPVWCGKCTANLDLDEFPISEELKQNLTNWNDEFHKHLIMHDFNGVTSSFAKKLNQEGEKWTNKLKEELPTSYTVQYRPYILITNE